jgi:TolB-like protein
MKPPPRIRLRLLGRLAVVHGDDPVPFRLSTRKAGALLAYLAMCPEQIASREELATLLWGSCSDHQARQSLRQALASLRKDLRWPNFLTADAEVVRLQAGLWSVDARELEQLSKSTDPEELARAARLFGGEFLSGLSIEEEGSRTGCATSAAGCSSRARGCARPWRHGLSSSPIARRPSVRLNGCSRSIRCTRAGNAWRSCFMPATAASTALAQAKSFAALLKRELGVASDESTRELIERVRNGEFAPAAAGPVLDVVPDPGSDLANRQANVGLPADMSQQRPRRLSARALVAGIAVALTGAGTVALAYLSSGPLPMPSKAVAQATAANSEYWRAPSIAASTSKDIIPIAVLPLSAVGDIGASTALIAEMMTDDLINILSRVPSFRVISRQTANRYQGQPIDIAAIGAELQVRYVLEGSIRAQDGGLRVNVQLLDPATRLPVWSGRVEREHADRYMVRDEIIARIARELQIDILPIEGERRSADHSADASTYLGWAAMQIAFSNISTDDYKRAELHFKQALARDPQHVRR